VSRRPAGRSGRRRGSGGPPPLPRGVLDADVDGFTHGGEGVARVEGKAVSVPGPLPGERVRIRIVDDRARWARATLDEVLERAPPSGTVFVGEGAARHRARLESAGFRVAADAGEEHLAEGALGTALLASWARPVAPAAWEPRYVRVSGAERTWSV